jgi:hypothetical protein
MPCDFQRSEGEMEKFRRWKIPAFSFLSSTLCASYREAILILFLKRVSKHAAKGQTDYMAIIVTTLFKLCFFFPHKLFGTQKVVLEFNVI